MRGSIARLKGKASTPAFASFLSGALAELHYDFGSMITKSQHAGAERDSRRRKRAAQSTGLAFPSNPAEDRQLVDRCLAGEPAAWDLLYLLQHEKLLASIRSFLPFAQNDPNLVEEIAARVWYAVVNSGGELLGQYQPARGARLSTFLAKIARAQASEIFRSERRRRRREAHVAQREGQSPEDGQSSTWAQLEEFSATLTRAERHFFEDELRERSENGPSESDFTQANHWQLRSRVLRKLQRFLG